MKVFVVAGRVILCLLIPLMCFLIAGLVLLPDTQWHRYAGARLEASADLSEQILPYLVGNGSDLDVPGLTLDEAAHLADVRVLVHWGLVILAVFTTILVVLVLFCEQAGKVILAGAILTLVFLSLLAVLPFDVFFSSFHMTLFPAGNYAFPETFLLIQTYPADFWAAGAKVFFGLTVFFAVLCVAVVRLGRILRTRSHL